MNFFSAINLIIIATNLPMAALLFRGAQGRRPNILLGYLCLAAVLWGLGSLGYASTQCYDIAYSCWKVANIGSISSTVIFYFFILSFLNARRPLLSVGVSILAAIFLYLNFFQSHLFIGELKPLFGQFYYISWPLGSSPVYLAYYIIFYILLLSYSFYLLAKEYRKTSGIRRQQIKYLFAGMAFGYIGCHACFLPVFGANIYPWLNLLIAFYIIPISYAIIKYQLMDINIIIKESLVYTVLISIITLLCLISVYFTERVVQSVFGYKSLLISTGAATAIALIFIPLRNFIQTVIERTLFHGSYMQVSAENEQLRQEVIKTERFKAVATLASGIAHEIRNPLTAIKTFNEYLPRKLNEPGFLQQYQGIVNQETARISKLIDQLLAFAKPTPPEITTVAPDKLVSEVLMLLEPQCAAAHIAVTTHITQVSRIQADPNQLKQALLNILLNAIDAMPAGGRLTVTVAQEDAALIITIQDTGCGIAAADLPHIFEPFYSKKDKGTGLGLSITQSIIENHKGKIEVHSQVNRGTRFTVTLWRTS